MPTTTDSSLTDGPFSLDIRVYYEDTDAAGVVYYANYLRFMERARTEWIRALSTAEGRQIDHLDDDRGKHGQNPAIFVVRRVEVDYGHGARLNDLLRVDVAVDDETIQRNARGAAIWLRQRVMRLEDASDPEPQLLVSGRVQLACVGGADFRPRRLPQWLAGRIRENG